MHECYNILWGFPGTLILKYPLLGSKPVEVVIGEVSAIVGPTHNFGKSVPV